MGLALALAGPGHTQQLSALAPPPNWGELEAFQETITRADFAHWLDDIYAPGGAARDFIDVQAEGAVIKATLAPPATWTLRFAKTASDARPVPRFWKTPAQLGPAPAERPLAGLKIALDPGHLGGAWARMEERFYQIGESRPVVEGDMTLRVANLLVPRLQALGAEVQLVRTSDQPATPQRPDTLRDAARAELARESQTPAAQFPASAVQLQSELLFYRQSEIRQRAHLVNEQIRPDLTLCLHFNAEGWGDPTHPAFVPRNHLHVLLNGAYSAGELRQDDVRFDMLMKLLQQCFPEELAAGSTLAATFARESSLPPYTYSTPNAIAVGGDGYLWARNLLANRLYRTPVIFLEPYVMNCEEVWERVQAGDYEGEILLAGASRKSIYREYADAVADGLRDYYGHARASK